MEVIQTQLRDLILILHRLFHVFAALSYIREGASFQYSDYKPKEIMKHAPCDQVILLDFVRKSV